MSEPYLSLHSSFDWRGGTYHLYRDTQDMRRFDVRLYREYPEGMRWWYGCGETWIEAVVRVLAEAATV